MSLQIEISIYTIQFKKAKFRSHLEKNYYKLSSQTQRCPSNIQTNKRKRQKENKKEQDSLKFYLTLFLINIL